MEIIETSIINFEDLNLPETLYKYRIWEDDLHKTTISKREVWFGSPNSFLDEFDCKIPTRYDLLSKEDILNKFYTDISLEHFRVEEFIKRMDYAIQRANNNLLDNREFLDTQQSQNYKFHNERTGVLSLSTDSKEINMWQKYAANHTGFCVGFYPHSMLQNMCGGGSLVLYYDELPIIYPTPKHSFIVQSYVQVYSKLRKWDFEKEYRARIFTPCILRDTDRLKIVKPEAFKEIIFGNSMSDYVIQQVIKSIPDEIKHINLKRAVWDGKVINIENF